MSRGVSKPAETDLSRSRSKSPHRTSDSCRDAEQRGRWSSGSSVWSRGAEGLGLWQQDVEGIHILSQMPLRIRQGLRGGTETRTLL